MDNTDQDSKGTTNSGVSLAQILGILSAVAVIGTLVGYGVYIGKLEGKVEGLLPGKAKDDYLNYQSKLEEERSKIGIPVGGVVAFWGNRKQIADMEDYEICDGQNVSTPGSPIVNRMKPDLTERFIRGTSIKTIDVTTDTLDGGEDNVNLGEVTSTSLTVAQLPRHDHSIDIKDHKHDIEDPGHTHFTKGNAGGWGGNDGFRPWNPPAHGQGVESEKGETGILLHNASLTAKVGESGEGAPHHHSIPEFDNRPKFLELFYIIRVK